MSERRVTIRDVAATAGVSVTTVSHALNGKGNVDPSTRQRVIDVAGELGYRASRAARALRSGRTGVIAMLLPAVETLDAEREILSLDYYMQLAMSAAGAAFERHHPLLLTPPLKTVAELRELGVDGGILCDPGRSDPRVALFEELDLPVVTIERDLGRPEHRWYVRGDNEANTRQLLDHLAEAGATRIAMLAAESDWAWSAESERAYRGWCEQRGHEPIVEVTGLHRLEASAFESAGRLLDRPQRPDAIFALAESYANGVVRAARDRGLDVPGDLLVASGIDSQQTREATPPITTIDLLPQDQGAAAARLLVARLEGEDPEAPVVVPAALRIRASTQR